jgi:hypothetical protein
MKGNKCCDVIWGIEVLRCLHCGKSLPKTVKVERDFPNFQKYKVKA